MIGTILILCVTVASFVAMIYSFYYPGNKYLDSMGKMCPWICFVGIIFGITMSHSPNDNWLEILLKMFATFVILGLTSLLFAKYGGSRIIKVLGYGILTYNLFHAVPTYYTNMLPDFLVPMNGEYELIPLSCMILLIGEIIGLRKKPSKPPKPPKQESLYH